ANYRIRRRKRTRPASGLPAASPLREGGVGDLDRLRVEAQLGQLGADARPMVALQVDLAVDDRAARREPVLERPGRFLEIDPRGEARDHRRGLVVAPRLGSDPDPGGLSVEGGQDLVELIVPHRSVLLPASHGEGTDRLKKASGERPTRPTPRNELRARGHRRVYGRAPYQRSLRKRLTLRPRGRDGGRRRARPARTGRADRRRGPFRSGWRG